MQNKRTGIVALVLVALVGWFGTPVEAQVFDGDEVLKVYRAKTLPSGVTADQKTKLNTVVAQFDAGDSQAAMVTWEEFCGAYFTAQNQGDLVPIQQWVVRKTYLKKQSNLSQAIEAWEEQLGAAGESQQGANEDLQKALQKQQQTIQMMSSMSRNMHDTAMAVIRKIS